MEEINGYLLTTLAQNPQYFDETITLIEQAFHYSSENSFIEDFYPLVNPLNFENSYLFIDKENNKVISHLAISKREMIKDNVIIDVGFIGGIATHSEYRNRGLFAKLMNHVVLEHQDECALFILWSEITGLYEKYQFSLCGGILETGKSVFSAENKPMGFIKTKFNLLSNNELEDIKNLYSEFNEKHFFTVKREDSNWSIITEMKSIDLYVKKDESRIIEYFCINKGRDLNNIIHEISCNPKHYKQLIKTVAPYKTWLPESQKSVISSTEIYFNCYIKIGNFKKLKSFIEQVTNNDVAISSIEQDFIHFQFNTKEYTVTHQDFFLYFFGPRPIKEFEIYGLSPYISGADSI